MLYPRFCSLNFCFVLDRQEVFIAGGLGSERLFSFRKYSLIINKLEAPEKAFVTLTLAPGVCPAALTFHGVSESVSKGKAAAFQGKPRGPFWRVVQPHIEPERTMSVPGFHISS